MGDNRLIQQCCAWLLLATTLLHGCSMTPAQRSEGHLPVPTPTATEASTQSEIPQVVANSAYLPPPTAQPKQERYTVVVNQVPVDELLFALARDAKLNIDIVGDIEGLVTLNALDQPLVTILDRLTRLAPIRYDLQRQQRVLIIEADKPYLTSYRIDYLNVARTSESSIALATELNAITDDSDSTSNRGNNSRTQLRNRSENSFWETLSANIHGLLGLSVSQGSDISSQDVIVNRETGLISVRATQREHREIQDYLNKVMSSARRQVLIEATVVEVSLDDSNETGIDWRVLTQKNGGTSGIDFAQLLIPSSPTAAADNLTPTTALLTVRDPGSSSGSVTATIKALQSFGDVQILSSPKIIALNNQPSVLKVVDNRVYFRTTVNRDPISTTNNGVTNTTVVTTFETEPLTVPIGLVMSVTPFISENDEVVLNVRPTISRILGFVDDPNPDLANANTTNRVPEIQVREMESMLRVSSGQVAVIGGLMQDSVTSDSAGVPGLSSVPVLGRLFSHNKDEVQKTELMVFLRPTVVKNASLEGDFKAFGQYLDPERQLEHSRIQLDGSPP